MKPTFLRKSAISLLAAGALLSVSVPVLAQAKAMVAEFTIDQMQAKEGDRVTAKLTIRNTGAAGNVPWEIRDLKTNQVLASGTQNIAAGGTFTATAPWSPQAGAQNLQASAGPAGTAAKKVVSTNIAARAQINTANLKQNIKEQTQHSGLKTEGDLNKQGPLSNMGGSDSGRPGGTMAGGALKGGTFIADKDGKGVTNKNSLSSTLTGQNVATGRHADTYAGNRANSRTRGDTRDFGGTGKDHAMQGGGDDDVAKTIADMLTQEGGTPTGDVNKDAAELSYAQSVGTDGYAATKNMTESQRADHWNNEKNKQMVGSSRPREDAVTGKYKPVTQSEVTALINRVRALKSKSGGAGDGRGDSMAGGGGPVGVMRGKDDAPEKQRATGTVNQNKVFEINQKVNPGAAANR